MLWTCLQTSLQDKRCQVMRLFELSRTRLPAHEQIEAWTLSLGVTSGFSVSKAFVRPGLLVALLIVLAPVYVVLSRSGLNASGNTITVNSTIDPVSTSDNGFCTLREAIDNANSPGTDTTGKDCAVGTGTINFSVSGTSTINLRSTLPAIVNTLTIDGGEETFTVNGGGAQVLWVNRGATLTLNDLRIENGSSGAGGGAYNGGTLTVNNSTIFGNTATSDGGGGVYNDGTLTVANSYFGSNSATGDGAGVYNGGTLTVTNSIIEANQAIGGDGGGIYNGGTLTVTNSLIDANEAIGEHGGGGVYNGATMTVTNSTFGSTSSSNPAGNQGNPSGGGIGNEGTLTVTNSTFSGNEGDVSGGGIANEAPGTLNVTNSTFSGNSGLDSGNSGSGGGISNEGTGTVTNSTFSGNFNVYNFGSGMLTLTNSILANSTSGGNCSGSIIDGGYNISDDASCGFGTSTGANGETIGDSVLDSNVALAAELAQNGGPTETIALELGSYAIAAIPIAHQCPATDQRGEPRPDPEGPASACDIGAFEYQGVISTPTPTATPTPVPVTLKIAPASLKFPETKVGTPSKPKMVKVSNPRGSKKHPGSPVLIEMISDPGVFTETNDCPSTLVARASCSIAVTFTPNAAIEQVGTLVITDNANRSPQTVQLRGRGK